MSMETLTDGVQLRFYMHMHARHDGLLVSEWLLEQAKRHKLGGGSVFRAIAGYGHHNRRHDQTHIELQGSLPLEIVFALSEEQADHLLQRVHDEKLELFYIRMPAQSGFTHDGASP